MRSRYTCTGCGASSSPGVSRSARYADSATCWKERRMPEAALGRLPRQRTLRRQVLGWLFWPLLALWTVSSVIDYDIANRFVNLAYDRLLLESALDIGRQVKVLHDRI